MTINYLNHEIEVEETDKGIVITINGRTIYESHEEYIYE